jgi:hypothetical protein
MHTQPIQYDFCRISGESMDNNKMKCLKESEYSWIIDFSGSPIEIIERIYNQTNINVNSPYTNYICGLSRAFIKMKKGELLDYYSKQILIDKPGIMGELEPVYEYQTMCGEEMLIEISQSTQLYFTDIIEWKFGDDVREEFYLYINKYK